MKANDILSSSDLERFKVSIYEPFAEFLMAGESEYKFEISLLDVVRFAGHACPSMVGAFLISQKAISVLFPDTHACIRGQVAIEIPSSVEEGATGPISNVFGMIFGAWDRSGFGGLQGNFARRGLMRYDSHLIPRGWFRFRNLSTGSYVDISYDPSKAQVDLDLNTTPFQVIWRTKIKAILQNPDQFLTVKVSRS